MALKWIKRRAHDRQMKKGGTAPVRESFFLHASAEVEDGKSYEMDCPYCGAKIRCVHMPNGGWVYFEAKMHNIKHPCFYLGEGMGNKDDKTGDLFAGPQRGRRF